MGKEDSVAVFFLRFALRKPPSLFSHFLSFYIRLKNLSIF